MYGVLENDVMGALELLQGQLTKCDYQEEMDYSNGCPWPCENGVVARSGCLDSTGGSGGY